MTTLTKKIPSPKDKSPSSDKQKTTTEKKALKSQADDALADFLRLMNERGLNTTQQRISIAKIFFSMKGHYSLEDIYEKINKRMPSIGQTTVYRTIKLLCEVGLAEELQVGDGVARYEMASDKEHHDHLVCKECGKTVEFNLPDVEKIQQELAESCGFTLLEHHHLLIGICDECSQGK